VGGVSIVFRVNAPRPRFAPRAGGAIERRGDKIYLTQQDEKKRERKMLVTKEFLPDMLVVKLAVQMSFQATTSFVGERDPTDPPPHRRTSCMAGRLARPSKMSEMGSTTPDDVPLGCETRYLISQGEERTTLKRGRS